MLYFFLKKFRGQKTWLQKIGDSTTTNLWRHLEKHHLDKNPKKKAKNPIMITEGQSTLDNFVGHAEFQSKVCIIL